MPNTYTISTSGGAIISGNISIDPYGYIQTHSNSDELPPITISSHDDNGKQVTMTLAPEAGISTGELSKLLMLTLAMVGNTGRSFSALNYVKKHNLERHFTYS